MKKNIISLAVIIVLISGCGKNPNSHLSYLPDNTAFIVSAQLGAIMEKADYQSALDSKAGQFFFDQLRKEKIPSIVKKAITNPQELGVDLNRPTYLFIEGFNKYNTYHEDALKAVNDIATALDSLMGGDLAEYTKLVESKVKYNKLGQVLGWDENIIGLQDLADLISISDGVKEKWNFVISSSYNNDRGKYDYNERQYNYGNWSYHPKLIKAVSTSKMEFGEGYEITRETRYGYYSNRTDFYSASGYGINSISPEPVNFGIISPILDVDLLKNKLQMVADLVPEGDIEEKKTDQFHYMMLKESRYNYETDERNMKTFAALGYNNEVVVFLGHEDRYDKYGPRNWVKEIERILEGTKSNNNLRDKPGIDDLENFDVGVWVDLTTAGDVMKQDLRHVPSLQKRVVSTDQSYITAGLGSDPGMISLKVNSYLNDEMKKQYDPGLFNQKIGKNLVNIFPNDPMAGMGFALNVKEMAKLFALIDDDEVKDVIDDIEKESGMSIDKLASIPSGNALAVLYDINIKRGQGEFAIGLELNDSETLIKLLNEKGSFPDKIVDNEPMMLNRVASLLFNGNYAFLTSPELVGSLKRGNNNSTFESEIPQKPSSSNFYAFADANQFFREIPADGQEIRILKEALLNAQLGMIDAGIMFEKSSISVFTNIRLKNTESNPLSIISEIALETIGDLID